MQYAPPSSAPLGRLCAAALCCAVLLGSTAAHATSRTRRGPTAGHHKKSKKHAAAEARPRAIDDARATEIQGALVKAGYLPAVSGHWDSESAAAMQKLQADNGWQTKIVPDSRALIKLGLGPGEGESTASSLPASAPSGAAAGGPGTGSSAHP